MGEQEQNSNDNQHAATVTEAFIFKLAKVLGGRDHVVDAPAAEILKFMEMELEKEKRAAEKEREQYWMNYLVTMFAQAPAGEEKPDRIQARKKFINAIKPPEQKKERKQYGWDHIPAEILREAEEKKRLESAKGE